VAAKAQLTSPNTARQSASRSIFQASKNGILTPKRSPRYFQGVSPAGKTQRLTRSTRVLNFQIFRSPLWPDQTIQGPQRTSPTTFTRRPPAHGQITPAEAGLPKLASNKHKAIQGS